MKKALIGQDGSSHICDDDRDYHCRDGMIPKDALQRGGKFTAKSGVAFQIIDAQFVDFYSKIKRRAQIILPKDIGTIITEAGITNKSIAVDAGTGSGSLSSFLALYAKKVYTFDNRPEHIEVAKENYLFLGIKNVVVKELDVYENDIPVKNADLVVLDLTEPWRAVSHVESALRAGGFLIAYNPQITQAMQLVNEMRASGKFLVLKVLENMQREWEIDGLICRPSYGRIPHTGFLVISRRIS